MIKKIIFAATIFVVMLGGAGCMNNRGERVNVNAEALAILEQKYGVKFEYLAPTGKSYSGTREFFVRSESFPGWNVLVEIENFRSEDRIFRDNFLAFKYRDKSIELFHTLATTVFSEARIHYRVANRGLSPDLPAEATFQEFLSDTRGPLIIMVELKASDFSSDEQIIKVADLFAENIALFNLTIIVVDDSIYGSLDSDELGKQIALRQFVRCAKITEGDGTPRIRWI